MKKSDVAVREPRIRPDRLIAAAIALAIIAAFAQVSRHGFVNYDDHRYITHNLRVQEGLTLDNIAWAFTTFEVANWHPLTWLSHMLDVTVFGSNSAGAHHLVNVAFHIANAVLVLMALNQLTGKLWRSATVAAIFALHPLRVESVAWISERKDVLCVFFGLLSLLAYVRYVKRPSKGNYAIVGCAFACSLMSKPMLVTLPAVLLLLDFGPLRRLRTVQGDITRVVLEKVPLLLLSIASAIVTIAAQSSGGSVSSIDELSVSSRLANAVIAYVTYMWQSVWPVNLAPLYPMPARWPAGMVAAAVGVLIVISGIVAMQGRIRPYLLTGWLWWLITLIPVIGLIQVGSQAHADRYTYFPHIGLLVMIVWLVPAPRTQMMKQMYAAAVGAVCVIFLVLTHRQAGFWSDSITLSERALRVTRNNAYAHFNLANAHLEAGRPREAVEQFKIAADLKPGWGDAPFNLGNAYLQLGDFDGAIAAFDEAIRRSPRHIGALTNRGIALAQSGRMDEAVESFERALGLDASNESALVNFGQTLARQNRLDEAMVHFERALIVNPNNAMAHLMLGNALARQDRVDEAIPHFAQALRINPDNPHAHMSMAAALAGMGRLTAALAHLRAAEQLARGADDQPLVREIQSRISRYQDAVKP